MTSLFSVSHSTCKALSIAILLCLAACSEKQTDRSATSDHQSDTALVRAAGSDVRGGEKKPPTDGGEQQKVQYYVQCYNAVNPRGLGAIERYGRWVKNMKTGPTGKETQVGGVLKISDHDLKTCTEKLPAAKAMAPAIPSLDNVADAYLKAVTELAGSLAEADRYYDQGDYKDDKFAKGKTMHPTLAARMGAFERASEKLSDAIEAENTRILDAKLARIEKEEGRKMTYLRLAVMQKAKVVATLLEKENFGVEAATKEIQALESLLQEAEAYSKQEHKDVPRMWSMVQRAGDEFLRASKERLRRVRDKEPYNIGDKAMADMGSQELIRGSAAKVIKSYNALVSYSNNER